MKQIVNSKIDRVFSIVLDENKKYRITIGRYVVSNRQFETTEDADKYIAKKPYELIMNLFWVMLETRKSINEETKEETKNERNK